jgi:glycosyltransferase involved in cell wall biosynthesis
MVPHVTVIICTRDRAAQLAACLDAVVCQRYPRFDILVVDNGSADPVDDICRQRGAACIIESVAGLTKARNAGARAAQGEIVAYIDDDAIAEPGWLAALAREFDDPAVAAVAGRTKYMKAQGESLRMSAEDAPGEVEARPRRAFDRDTRDWFTLACFGRIGDGNTMAFRREVLINAVRFDERLGRGRLVDSGDEHVAFMSLISDGHRVMHAPAAVVRHPAPAEPALRRAKRFRDLRGSIVYALFLWYEFPGHRRDLARFAGRAVLRRIPGRGQAAPATAGLSLVQVIAAVAGGIRRYRKARQEWPPRSPIAGSTVETVAPRVVTTLRYGVRRGPRA